MRIRLPSAAALGFVLCCCTTPSTAETVQDEAVSARHGEARQATVELALHGSAWSSNRLLDDTRSLVGLVGSAKLALPLPMQASAVLDGHFSREIAGAAGESRDISRLKEAYLRVRRGNWLVTAGAQIVSWGRADVINPTDNVAAYDLKLLVPSDAEQKLGVGSLVVIHRSGAVAVQAIWQPVFRASDMPLARLPGVKNAYTRPESSWDAGGLKVDVVGDRLAWSVSYFSGPSKLPSPSLSLARLAAGYADFEYPDTQTFGVDFEYLVGRWIVRGEGAFNYVAGSGDSAIANRESFASAVLGVERDLGDTSGFLQLIYRHGFDHIDPYAVAAPLARLALYSAIVNNEVRESLLGVGGGFAFSTNDMRWSLSADAAYFPVNGDYAIRPRLRYQASDRVSVWAGVDWFNGPQDGQFGRLHKNTVAFVGVTLSGSVLH